MSRQRRVEKQRAEASVERVAASCAGGMIATFLLVGRWTPGRLTGGQQEFAPLFMQPRVWLGLGIAVCSLLLLPARTRGVHRYNPELRRMSWMTAGFLLYMASTAVWAPNQELADQKLIDILVLLGGLLLTTVLFQMTDPQQVAAGFWRTVCLIGLALLGLGYASMHELERVAVLGGGPNVFGRNLGLFALSCVHLGFERKSLLPGAVWGVGVVVGGLMVMMSGSRGALVAAGVAAASGVFRLRAPIVWRAAVVLVLSGTGYLVVEGTTLGVRGREVFEARILDASLRQQYDSGRLEILETAWDIGRQDMVLGAGLNAFPALTPYSYPHNILAEAFSEGGLVGLVFLAAVLARFAWVVLQHRREVSAASLAAFLLVLTGSMFSGDLYDSRGVFIVMFVTLAEMSGGARQRGWGALGARQQGPGRGRDVWDR